jgi:hypothetical protein
MEHRWGRRRQVILPIQFSKPGQPAAAGWITDISLSGAYLLTTDTFVVAETVYIELDGLSGRYPECVSLQLPGRVVRHGLTGVGIDWEEFASATLAEIVRIATVPGRPRIGLAVKRIPGPSQWAIPDGGTSDERLCSITP